MGRTCERSQFKSDETEMSVEFVKCAYPSNRREKKSVSFMFMFISVQSSSFLVLIAMRNLFFIFPFDFE